MVVVKRPASPEYGAEVDVGEKVITPTNNARAGVAHHHVRKILLISTLALVVVFGIVYLAFFAG